MAVNSPNSPRQKMINLMYLVFIGMLALNVSTEVLDGFRLVEDSLLRSVKSSNQRNDQIFAELEEYFNKNDKKAGDSYLKGKMVKDKTDSLYNYTQDLKNRIVIKADGKNGDPENLKHPDDLNAAYEIMFERGKNDGAKLKTEIDLYREFVSSLVSNASIKNIIESNLSTEPTARAKENKQSWEESMFWQMPLAAAVTLLTKIQNDIRYAESAVLTDLLKNVDFSDYRVNDISAFVIPVSQTVMSGSNYDAKIVLAAIDSTKRPRIFVNGTVLSEEGRYVVRAGAPGSFPVKGYIQVAEPDGSTRDIPFDTKYFVQAPSVTIAPLLMNILYAGYDMEVEVAVPGIANTNVTANMTNGSLTPKGNGIWIAKAAKANTEAVITAKVNIDGRTIEMNKSFRVRPLPDPTPQLTIQGEALPFKGGALSKASLLNVNVAEAAIDDGILKVPFTVLSFEVSTTNSIGVTVSAPSDGARFSERQKALLRELPRGKMVYLRRIVARGPDGVDRTLNSPLEIIIN